MRDDARNAAQNLARGQAERVRLDLPDRHLVIDNDGQLLCFFCAPGDRALYFDINGQPDDPRLIAHEAGHLFRRTWTWLRVPGSSRLWHFETSGEALQNLNLVRPNNDAAYDWEEALGFSPWPKDGDMVALSAKRLEKIGARIARGTARSTSASKEKGSGPKSTPHQSS